MEASQRRVSPTRISESPSLPQQSLPPVSDGNVRELPPRLLSVTPPPLPPAKQKTQTNRASRKSKLPLWKHWVTYSQLRTDKTRELKLLNEQFLAEQTALQYEARSSLPSFELDRSPVSHVTPPAEVRASGLPDEAADRLQSKLAYVRQIVSDFGVAIAEGETLTQKNDRVPLPPSPAGSPVTRFVETAAPPETLSQTISQKADQVEAQEAAATAATLRQLAVKARSASLQPPASVPTANLPTPSLQLSYRFMQSQNQEALNAEVLNAKRSRRRRKFRLRDRLQLPQRPVDRVVDALTWIVLAGGVRIGIRFLLMAVPALSPVAIGLMVLPAAIGIFLLLFVPKAGYLPIYRLFLVTLGLLLGGKL